MLAQLQRESFTKRNNEMVVDLSSVAPHMPEAVQAFFVVEGAPDYKLDYAIKAYQSYKAYYNMQSNHAPPLVVIDFAKDGDAPFALHPMLADVANDIPY